MLSKCWYIVGRRRGIMPDRQVTEKEEEKRGEKEEKEEKSWDEK
jgi:hypothetical protein